MDKFIKSSSPYPLLLRQKDNNHLSFQNIYIKPTTGNQAFSILVNKLQLKPHFTTPKRTKKKKTLLSHRHSETNPTSHHHQYHHGESFPLRLRDVVVSRPIPAFQIPNVSTGGP